ncbi:heparinase II/III domain-containing protein [Isoalcanivorax beigongshangi]|uniref:Heparinase II/III family protein n=1 Tax=Isoalcanivorax beigongshangi TaxID=3238810 RepID=A0ABV4AIH6_9GAMM
MLIRILYTLLPLRLHQWYSLLYYRIIRRFWPFRLPPVNGFIFENRRFDFQKYMPSPWHGNNEFTFLNVKGKVRWDKFEPIPEQAMLWQYNLHYLDELWACNSSNDISSQRDLILAWWEANKEVLGVPWDPYPTSLRAVNLCKWLWLNPGQIDSCKAGTILGRHYIEIRRKLEIHLQANHLFANLKALWFIQAALPEVRSRDWQWLIAKIKAQISEQFDDCGGHFELSPMYHRIMLWDLMDMLELASDVIDFSVLKPILEDKIRKGLRWAIALSHSDGEIALFNDGALGGAPSLNSLICYASKLGVAEPQFKDGSYSGYLVTRKNIATLICDAAPVGPAFQPGHAHADSLSFELSLGLSRVVVNSGTSVYELTPERLYQRSTAAHNTVVVDGKNSSDVWSSFRVGRKARASIIRQVIKEGFAEFEASHDGYRGCMHRRLWRLSDDRLTIRDSLNGKFCEASAFFHFHPEVKINILDRDAICVCGGDFKMKVFFCGAENLEVRIKDGFWYPKFGEMKANKFAEVTWSSGALSTEFSWEVIREGQL